MIASPKAGVEAALRMPLSMVYTGYSIWFRLCMKLISRVLLLMFLASSARGASLEGEVLFSRGKSGGRGNVIRKEFGAEVKATTDWWLSTMAGKEMIFAGLKVINTGSKPVYCSYYVAFYDRERALVCTGSSQTYEEEGLLPGKPAKTMPCMMYLPKDKYKDIFSFHLILYEMDSPLVNTRKKATLLEDPEPRPRPP
jgi:hypothetical protein